MIYAVLLLFEIETDKGNEISSFVSVRNAISKEEAIEMTVSDCTQAVMQGGRLRQSFADLLPSAVCPQNNGSHVTLIANTGSSIPKFVFFDLEKIDSTKSIDSAKFKEELQAVLTNHFPDMNIL